MDLFDQLKTAGPVEKGFDKNKSSSSKKDLNSSSSKKNDSPNKPVVEKSKKNIPANNKEDTSSKNSSHGKVKPDINRSSNKNVSESVTKKDEKFSKKKSTHGSTAEDTKNMHQKSSPIKDNQSNNKKSSSHNSDVSPQKNHDQKVAKSNDKHKSSVKHKSSNDNSFSQRRESLPTSFINYDGTADKKTDKSRSLSPPKGTESSFTKSLKIKLDRKNVQEFLDHSIQNNAGPVKSKKHDKQKDTKQQDRYKEDKHKEDKTTKEPKKMTPTKAQQKLFEPLVRQKKTKSQILKEFNVKPCVVRIHRDNFQKLMREMKKNKSLPPIKPIKISKLTLGIKRPADLSPPSKSDGPPAKKGKSASPSKLKANFFIKLNTPKLDKTKGEKSKMDKAKLKLSTKPNSRTISSSSVAQHNKIKNSKFSASTTPTKFSRSHLISSFGKRWFQSYVRVEKCGHPLMLTFESNARARRLQTKQHNKSKNLSVSFREQVEVFGGSSDSDDSYDENFCPTTSRNGTGRRVSTTNSAIPVVPVTPVVMPARLKKVENGKVVDDILLDPSLFLDPQNLVASTPYSPGRKKRDHKSFSPLKDEGSPSPRKEQLKLANERVPPSGLRRLNIEEEDDEDDDCEYIVPIELPQRRASRTSSTNTIDGGPTVADPPDNNEPIDLYSNTSAIFTEIDEAITLAKRLVSPATITSAKKDNNAVTKTNRNNYDSDQTESHDSFVSATDQQIKEPDGDKTTQSTPLAQNDDVLNHVAPNNIPELNGNTNVNNTIVGDLSSINDMNLFIEDSQTNDDDSPEKSFVDSIINETIDKLGKDIGCDDNTADNQQYRNAI